MSILKKNYFFFIIVIIILIINIKNIKSEEVKIIVKIDGEIITNIDIENEYKYLTALNTSLKDIKKDKILDLAKKSLIKEKIKKKEILKFYELNKKNETIDVMIENIYKNLGLNSQLQFESYLGSLNLNFENIYKKIEIETVWNQMIYARFKNKVIIDEKNLKKEIKNDKKELELFLLYELIFDFKNKNEIEKKYLEITEHIKSVGFEESVIKYSIADSKKKSGLIGWVNKNALSKKIKDKIIGLNIGEISKPIILPSGILLLKIEDKKIENSKIDVNKELEKRIKYELNSQLNNYSTLLYNKTKKNLIINEY